MWIIRTCSPPTFTHAAWIICTCFAPVIRAIWIRRSTLFPHARCAAWITCTYFPPLVHTHESNWHFFLPISRADSSERLTHQNLHLLRCHFATEVQEARLLGILTDVTFDWCTQRVIHIHMFTCHTYTYVCLQETDLFDHLGRMGEFQPLATVSGRMLDRHHFCLKTLSEAHMIYTGRDRLKIVPIQQMINPGSQIIRVRDLWNADYG